MKKAHIASATLIGLITYSASAIASSNGLRSVQINLANMTSANFTIEAATLNSGSWSSRMQPIQGESFRMYESLQIGSYTNNINGGTSGALVLTGYGEPISIHYSLSSSNQFDFGVSGRNSEVSITTHHIDTGAANKIDLNITIAPATAASQTQSFQ